MSRSAFGGGPATGPARLGCCAVAGPGAGRAGGSAAGWQPGRAGTETGELTANPEGGRSDTLGVGAGPASGQIGSPAIVPAGIATPNARDRHLLWAWRYQDRCPASQLTQPVGGQAAWPGAGAWLPGSWQALVKGSGSDLSCADPLEGLGRPAHRRRPPARAASGPASRAGRQKGCLQCGHRRICSHPRGERAGVSPLELTKSDAVNRHPRIVRRRLQLPRRLLQN
jgi:hypothetical protein